MTIEDEFPDADELTQITEFVVSENDEFYSFTMSVGQVNGRNVGMFTSSEHGHEAIILPSEYVPQLIQALMKVLPPGEKQ